jgi:hypothetical protein
MSSESHPNPALPKTDGVCKITPDTPGEYPASGDTSGVSDFPSAPSETTQPSTQLNHAILPQLTGSDYLDFTTPSSGQPGVISPKPEESVMGDSGVFKDEQLEEDDTIQFIKEEDSDDVIIRKPWSIDEAIDVDAESITIVEDDDLASQADGLKQHDSFIKQENHVDLVIPNIWSLQEAIDVDAESVTESTEGLQAPQQSTKVVTSNRFQEAEEDRVNENHQLERIELTRQRLQVRSIVNAATKHSQPDSGSGNSMSTGIVTEVDNSDEVHISETASNPTSCDRTYEQNIALEGVDSEDIIGPHAIAPRPAFEG